MQAKRLALVAEKLVGEAQSCTLPSRVIQDNIHLIRYTIDRMLKLLGMGGTLAPLDQSKSFDMDDRHYLETVLKSVGLSVAFSVV